MPRLPSTDVKIFNPATGTKQSLQAWSMPQLLPDLAEVMSKSGGSPSVQQAAQTDWTVRTVRNWQVGAQLSLGSLVSTVGIPTFHVFEDVMQAIGIDAGQVFNDALRDAGKTLQQTIQRLGQQGDAAVSGALESSLSTGVGHAVNNVAVIPVLGWVIQIVVALVKLVPRIIDIQKASQLPPTKETYPPSEFTAEGDTAVFERLYFDRIRRLQDWTPIYMPPTLGKTQSHHAVFVPNLLEPCSKWDKRGRCDNDRDVNMTKWQCCNGIRFVGGNPIAGAAGNVPGTGWLHQSIEYFKHGRMLDPGMYLQSTRSQAGWLWQSAIKGNTPTAFTIDADTLAAMWETYIMDLRIALSEAPELNNTDRRRILAYWNGGPDDKGRYRKIFGWVDPNNIAVKPVDNEWERYQPVKEARALHKKQRRMLDTIAVAYLDDSFPAVNKSASPEFHELWERRRRQLLEHPDRCLVDLTAVPDGDYRRALKDRGVGAGVCAAVGGDLATPGESSLRPSRTTPGLGQDGMPGDGGGTPSGTKRSTSGSALLAAAGVAAVGIAAHKGYFDKIF